MLKSIPALFMSFILTGFSRYGEEVDTVVLSLKGPSEYIIKDSSAQHILTKGSRLLPLLSERFTDTVTSPVYSKCASRYLTRGELAIILADHIEAMPYFKLTGMENCMLQSCEGNPNFIEYYLNFIRLRGMTVLFQQRYNEWLNNRK